jgi:pantothenate kinase
MADMAELVRVSGAGSELAGLARRATGHPGEGARPAGRRIVGIAGEPGAGKSHLAAALVEAVGGRAAVVPLDGFHLADSELVRQGLLERKGAPETFDAWGYAALLARLRGRPPHPVYAPGFERVLEQPLAAAVAVAPEVELVVTEGNYLLLDRPEWRAARAQLDEVWFVQVDRRLRLERLVARHETFGKTPDEARRWVDQVDEPNALLIASTRHRADVLVDVTEWTGVLPR